MRTLALLAVLPRILGMDDALQLFRERGFDLLLADAQVAAARAEERAAQAIANPQLGASAGHAFGYDAQCPGCSPNAWSAGITDPQAISDLIFGKRGLRKDVARAAVEAARQSRADALRTLSLRVRQAMLDAALQQRQRDLARELGESSEHTRALNEKRMAAGAISEAELARAEVAALEAQQAVELAAQALREAQLQIGFLLGERELIAEFEVDPSLLDRALPPPAPGVEQLVQEALSARPDLQAARLQTERAEAAVSLAERQRIPDLSLSAQYLQQGTGNNAIQPGTLTLGAQFTLPIFDLQQGPIARAEADLRTQRISFDRSRAQLLLDVQSAHAALEANRRLVERMRARLLDRARRARDLVQVQYEKGAASLLELLDAQRTWAQTHAEYLKDLHDFWTAFFQLEAAVGKT